MKILTNGIPLKYTCINIIESRWTNHFSSLGYSKHSVNLIAFHNAERIKLLAKKFTSPIRAMSSKFLLSFKLIFFVRTGWKWRHIAAERGWNGAISWRWRHKIVVVANSDCR